MQRTKVTDMSDLLRDTLVLGGKKSCALFFYGIFRRFAEFDALAGWLCWTPVCVFCYSDTLHGWGLSLISFSITV